MPETPRRIGHTCEGRRRSGPVGSDSQDVDTDNDGLFDGTEILGWTFYFSNGATKLFTSNATVVDTDGDGLNDTQEYGDGVTFAGSDPRDVDTDHDGFCDKATDTCVQDTDNSTFDRTAPLIENVTISVNSTNTGIYYIQVKVSATDLSKLFMIVITFLELAPALKPDPMDEGIDDAAPEMASKSVQKVAPIQVENDAAIVDPEPEGPDVNTAKFRYGYQHPWSVYWNGTGTSKFENFTAVFAIPDRGILTAGFHILVEAMDQQGNINAVEKTHAIEKNFWEKTADKLKEWFDLAGAVARAFLAWLVEAVGPIIGMTLGLLLSIAKNIVDMIFGLPQMIEMMVNNFNEMVDSFGAMFGNLGAVFAAMIDQMITEAEQVLPGAWKQYAKPNATTILQEIIRFFQNPFGFTASNPRMFFAIAWVVGSIIGFVVMNFLGGGAAVLGKLKSLAGIGKVAKDLKNIQSATKVSQASRIATKVSSSVSHAGEVIAGGARKLAIEIMDGLESASQKAMQSMQKFFKGVRTKLESLKAQLFTSNKNFAGTKLAMHGDDVAREVGADASKVAKGLRRPGAISTHHLDDPAAASAAVSNQMDKYGDWSKWGANKKKSVFGTEATDIKLRGEGHTVYRKPANAGGTDFNDHGIDLISKKDGKWNLHEVKATGADGGTFSDPLRHQLDGTKRPAFDKEWIRANLDSWVDDGVISKLDAKEILDGLENGNTLRSVTIVSDQPMLPGRANLMNWGRNLDEVNSVSFDGAMATTLGSG